MDRNTGPHPRSGGHRLRVAVAFLLAALVCGSLVTLLERDRRLLAEARVDSLARDHLRTLVTVVDRSLTLSYAVGALIRQGEGELPEFQAVARELFEYYPSVSALALSPDGVISDTYPLEENRASLGFDQFADPLQGAEARRARDSGELTLAGPLELVQGGPGLVGRLPVFLDGDVGTLGDFWGLVSVVLPMEDVLREAGFGLLPELGISYRLLRLEPGTGDRTAIAASGPRDLRDPTVHEAALPNGTWVLEAAPEEGWTNLSALAVQSGVALLVSALEGC